MTEDLEKLKQDFISGLSNISGFWGFPKGMGAIFAVLYLSPGPLSLDELVSQTSLTKGAISTNVRGLARLGLIHPVSQTGDRRDYYVAETDFYRAVRAILQERRNSDFDRAVATVQVTLKQLEQGDPSDPQRAFMLERLRALKDFFDALDSLVNAVTRLDGLGLHTVQTVLKILK
jgi:HTH-type transcriptional regulator, glycine betaine synthesis regulator